MGQKHNSFGTAGMLMPISLKAPILPEEERAFGAVGIGAETKSPFYVRAPLKYSGFKSRWRKAL